MLRQRVREAEARHVGGSPQPSASACRLPSFSSKVTVGMTFRKGWSQRGEERWGRCQAPWRKSPRGHPGRAICKVRAASGQRK
eukprot:992414-Rhodomonas_salina.2